MEYQVTLDNEETNEIANTLSLTGTVNGQQCAAVIRLSTVKGLDLLKAKRERQKALVLAYENRSKRVVAGAEKVSL